MTARLTIWGTPPARALLARRFEVLPFPLGLSNCRLYSRARHALFAGVRQLGVPPGDEVLVPAYHHGSEVEALLRAGLRCRFYDVAPTLEPDVGALDALVGPRTRALLLVHYMGRPQASARWRQWCDERDLLLFEDAAQSWLAQTDEQPVGSLGQLAISCLYKTLPIPDGAVLVCDPPPTAPPHRVIGVKGWARARVTELGERWPVLRRVGERVIPPRADHDVEAEFTLGNPDAAPAMISSVLLPRLVRPTIAEQRRSNYRALTAELERYMRAPFDALPAGASPMILPLTVDAHEKAGLRLRLEARRIESVDFWADPHPSLPVEDFPVSAHLRSTIVGVPVHQGLTERDRRRIVAAVCGP